MALPTVMSPLSATDVFIKKVYLEEFLETRILYFLNSGCYDWILNTRCGAPL
jgi:hypothetical protein